VPTGTEWRCPRKKSFARTCVVARSGGEQRCRLLTAAIPPVPAIYLEFMAL
jgi:hypothetical protein